MLPFQRYCEVGSSKDTIETLGDRDGFELDLVTHDVRKFLLLLHKPNGYVLEQLLSPLVLRSSTWHEELVALAPRLVTRNHAQHYLGFAKTPRKLFHKTEPRRIKPLLYLYRVLLTGIHLMRTGRIQPNLEALLAEHPQPSVADLIQEKRSGKEHGVLASPGISMHARALDTLEAQLLEAGASSRLPDAPECLAELEDLHFRVRTEACHDPEPPR